MTAGLFSSMGAGDASVFLVETAASNCRAEVVKARWERRALRAKTPIALN